MRLRSADRPRSGCGVVPVGANALATIAAVLDRSGPPRRLPAWAPLLATCLGQFMVVLDATVVNVALPAIRRGLHLGTSDLQWVVNAYLLTLGGLILLGGRLGDHFGRKRMYLVGAALFSAASLAGGLAPSGGVLLGARAVQGVGAALLAPGTLSLLTSVYTERRARTRALAIWSVVSASGATLGVILGGVLTYFAGWRWVMFVNVPIGVLVLLLGGAALPETIRREGAREKLDVPGALTITAALAALAYGVVETESHGWGSTRTLAVLGVAAALAALAVAIEARAQNALIPFAVVRRGPIATAVVMIMILGGVINATIYFQSLWLQLVRGYTPLGAGLLLLPAGCVVMATPAFAARATTRYGPQIVAAASLAAAGAAVLWMSRWGVHGSVVVQQVMPSMLFAAGGSVCFFAITFLLTSAVEQRHSGLGSGLFNAGRQVGGSITLAVMTVIAATHTKTLAGAGHGASRGQTAAGYGFAMISLTGLAVAGVVLIVAYARRRGGRSATRSATDAERRAPEPASS
jgi:EmrB/QacA subfamily drug resistance transporter